MEYQDVTPTLVLGEARGIAPGKLILQVFPEEGPVRSGQLDFALVALGADRKASSPGPVVSRETAARHRRGVRLLFDRTEGGKWFGAVFEISTPLTEDETAAYVLVADGLTAVTGRLFLLLEDGLSRPHLFAMDIRPGTASALALSIYRHGRDWKLRATGQCYQSDRSAIVSELSIGSNWPVISPTASSVPPPGNPPKRHDKPPAADDRSVARPASGPPPLDMSRLSAIERDTAAVSELLSGIFSDVSHKEVQSPPAKRPVQSVPPAPSGLDAPHRAVLDRIMTDNEMSSGVFSDLARLHGLMPSGAVETVNDWVFDLIGDIAIIDDGTGYRFNEEMRRSLEHHLD